MIDSLMTLLLPLTLLLTILLVSHKWLIKLLGANNTYFSWLMVPLGLIVYSLPLPWQQISLLKVIKIQHFLVNPTVQLQQSISFSWTFYIWLSVAVSMMTYWLLTYNAFTKHLQLTVIDKSTVPLTLPTRVQLYQSSSKCSPMLVGVISQKLIIPKNFFELYNIEQQKLILEHEICHFDRNDIYWNLVAITCLTLFWFHPLAWLAYFRFRQDQELSCDQLVLARKTKESRINYSKALLMTAQSTPSLAFAQLSFTKYGDKQVMLERINNLKASVKTSKKVFTTVILTAITLLSGLSYAGNQHDNVGGKQTESMNIKPIVSISPKYPIKAAQEGIEGSVVLQFNVTENGSVENVMVITAKPAYVFDKAAVTALKKWKYSPVNHLGKNYKVQLDFTMDKNSSL